MLLLLVLTQLVTARTPCCESRPNCIALSGQRLGGLQDRRRIFEHYGTLADALCANLLLESPHSMLTRHHNANKSVSKKRQWSDYFEARNSDGGPLFVKGCKKSNKHTLQDNNKLADDFTMAQEFSGDSFFWNLSAYYYTHGTRRHAPELWLKIDKAREHCSGEVTIYESEAIKAIALEVARNASGKHSPIVTIHLRRGDALGSCDTSISVVAQRTACAIALSPVFMNTTLLPLTLLIFTDEQDPLYRKKVRQSLEMSVPNTRNVILADHLISDALALEARKSEPQFRGDPDNYLTYAVLLSLRTEAAALDIDFDRHEACASHDARLTPKHCPSARPPLSSSLPRLKN